MFASSALDLGGQHQPKKHNLKEPNMKFTFRKKTATDEARSLVALAEELDVAQRKLDMSREALDLALDLLSKEQRQQWYKMLDERDNRTRARTAYRAVNDG